MKFVRWLDFALDNLFWWLDDHTPVQCVRCKRIMFFKDSEITPMTVGTTIHLCKVCHDDVYHPFTRGKE